MAGLLLPFAAVAQLSDSQLTPEQVEMLQALTPEQKAALARAAGKGANSDSDTQAPPAAAKPADASAAFEDETPETAAKKAGGKVPAAVPRAKGQDTLVLQIERRKSKPNDKDDDKTALELPPEGDKLRPRFITDLLGSHVFKLDRDGVLHLTGFEPIALAGLAEPQIAMRIASEPLLKQFTVIASLLPVLPQGADALKPFGRELFRQRLGQQLAAPDIPVPMNYVLGPGDTVKLHLYGKQNANLSLIVTRDGTLNLPGMAPFTAAGLRFEALQDLITARVSKEMIGVSADVTMGPLRSVQVFVLGDVKNPGAYTVGGMATVSGALLAAGGLSESGSMRNIAIKRSGKKVAQFDLYDFLLHGDTADDKRLQPGDAVFVGPLGDTVAVGGEVQRPAIYELRGEKSLSEVLALAGGLKPTADRSHIQVQRIDRNTRLQVLDYDLSRAAQAAVRGGDRIVAQMALDAMENYVEVMGYVRRPGRYEWQPHAHLSSILPSADYLKELPDLGYVLIVRETGPERREQVLSAKLDAAWTAVQGPDDPELRSRDRIIVFGLKEPRGDMLAPVIERLKLQAREEDPQQVVRIGGHIPFPGDYPLEPGMRVADLIRAAGGLSEDAYRTEAEIVRYSVVDHQKRQTEVMSVPLAQVIAGDAVANALLQPFDDLQIRPLPAWGERVTVKIEGEVRFPGEYVTYRGDTLGHLVERAGGLTAQAYPEGAVLLRESLRKEEEEQKQALQERLRSQIVTASLQQSQLQPDKLQSLQLAQQMLTSLETTKAAGRLVIDLDAQLKAAPGEGVRVQKDDRLFVPQHPQTVSIYGEVNFPTSHLYEQGLSRDDYIRLSGGLTKQADKGRIYVVRANGEVLAAGGWFSVGSQQMQPGDTIVVPPDTDSLKSLMVLTSVSQILYQIGLAAAAFHAIGGF